MRAAQPLSTVANDAAQYTARYQAYARAHGVAPAEMLERDCAAYPGGRMCGFVVWIGRAWDEWERLTGRPSRDAVSLTVAEHGAFDEWLSARGAA